MAATTTLKLPEELKARIASAAQASGKAPHALMIDALSVQMALFERRQAFIASAMNAEQEVAEYGLVRAASSIEHTTHIFIDSTQRTPISALVGDYKSPINK